MYFIQVNNFKAVSHLLEMNSSIKNTLSQMFELEMCYVSRCYFSNCGVNCCDINQRKCLI